MLNLVAPGPKLIVAKTENQQALKQYLQEQFQAIEMNQLGLGEKDYNIKCIVCVADTVQPATGILYLGMTQTVEYVLCHLMHEQAKALITAVRALPQVVVFNSLGEYAPVADKMQAEFQCERVAIRDVLLRENNEGVIVAFLMQEAEGKRAFYSETLFIQQPYEELIGYLRIHAPRYLAKAFAPNAWHMVDLRIYDRYEVYDLQYKRLAKAIKAAYPAYYENDGTLVLMEGDTMEDDGLPEKGKNYIFVGTAQPDGSIFLESLYAKPNLTMPTIKSS